MSTSSSSKPTTGWQPPTLEEMQAMLPQYQFECLLGRGGMGAVYKALQVSLDRLVAIKVLPTDLIDDNDANFLERFKNEARTMAKLNHPSIVNVYEFGETQSGLLYFVMEFINGTDVHQMIASQGRLPEDYALSITAHVCDALNYAHKNGVIHRDIKPANILINMDGAVKVADFGLAKQSDAGQSGLTKTNMAMGTPDFVAPEALIPGIPLDGRADLYAIGVMLYQMLTGEIPRGIWTLPGMKIGTDPRFDAIITKAMQTDRDVRYQSAADLRRDLDTILTLPRSALIAQQQAAAEATARATRGQKQHVAVPHKQPAAPAKGKPSLLRPILGIAAIVSLVAALLFILKPATEKPQPVTSTPPATPTITPTTVKLDALPEEGGWLDLLPIVKTPLEVIPVGQRHRWSLDDATLAVKDSGPHEAVALPVDLPASYDVSLRMKTEGLGISHMGLLFPVAGHMMKLNTIQHDLGTADGSTLIDTIATGDQPPSFFRIGPSFLQANVERVVEIAVREGGGNASITIKADGQNVFEWSGPQDKLGDDADHSPHCPRHQLSLTASMGASGIWREVRARRVSGAAALPRPPSPPLAMPAPAPASSPAAMTPPPAPPQPATVASTTPAMPATTSMSATADLPAGAINLLTGLDVEKNKLSGDWSLVNGELVSDTGKADSEINLPATSVPSECDIRYRLSRTGGFQMQFRTPFGIFNTDGWTGNKGNNEEIILRWQGDSNNKQITRNGKLLQSGGPQELLLQIRREHITVLLDGQEVLGGIPPASSPNSTGFGLRVARGKVTFHSIHIVPMTDKSTPVMASTPSAPSAPPQPATVASTTPAMTNSPATPPTVAVGTPAADLKSGAVQTFGGHRYQLISEALDWDAAKARAESMGGHLATITSKEERDWLHTSLSLLKGTCTHVLLGGQRSTGGGPWSWATGEPFDMTLWPGPPATKTDPHLAFYVDLVTWDDIPRDLKFPLLVEWDWAEFLAAHPQLGKLETGFRTRYDADAQKPFLAALQALNQSYVSNGIAKIRAAAQSKGSLFEVTMLDAEKALIEKGEPVPAEDAAEAPASLKALRATYRSAFAKIAAERDAKAAPLYDLYLKALDAYIAELTKTGKTDAAVNVQSLRAEIAAQKPAVAAAVAATAATPKTTLTPTPKAPSGGGSSWRVAAEYLVNNGGSFVALKNGITTALIAKPAEIPTGKFDILELVFERLNSVLPPAQDADFAAFSGLRDLRRAHFRPMHNGLSDAAFAFLANNDELAFLNFEGANALTDGVLSHIAGLKKLDYLGIQYAENFTGQGFDKIAGAASITNLELLSSGITDEGLKAISTFKKLQSLRVNSPKVTTSGYAALASLKTLASLAASSTAFDDEAAGLIATMPNLSSLDLGGTKITDTGLMKLKPLKKLSTLNLANTAVTAEAAAEFQKLMPQCRVSR